MHNLPFLSNKSIFDTDENYKYIFIPKENKILIFDNGKLKIISLYWWKDQLIDIIRKVDDRLLVKVKWNEKTLLNEEWDNLIYNQKFFDIESINITQIGKEEKKKFYILSEWKKSFDRIIKERYTKQNWNDWTFAIPNWNGAPDNIEINNEKWVLISGELKPIIFFKNNNIWEINKITSIRTIDNNI